MLTVNWPDVVVVLTCDTVPFADCCVIHALLHELNQTLIEQVLKLLHRDDECADDKSALVGVERCVQLWCPGVAWVWCRDSVLERAKPFVRRILPLIRDAIPRSKSLRDVKNTRVVAYASRMIFFASFTSPLPFRASNPTAYHAEYRGLSNYETERV